MTSLRSILLRMTLATLLPLLLFGGVAAWLLIAHEREASERGARERVRALSTAVDAQLGSSLAVLETLAESTHFDRDDLPGFEERARRTLAQRTDWVTVHLALPSGQQVMSTREARGDALPQVAEMASFEEALRSRKPVIGDMVLGQSAGQYDFAVRVPVVRDGQLRFVLSAVVDPAAIGQLLKAQQLPADWVGVIVDRNRRFVARTLLTASTLGQPASKDLTAALNGPEAEVYRLGRTREGTEVYTASMRSAFSGWGVAIGVPASVVEAGARRMAWVLAVGTVLVLALAFGLASWQGRRLATPITALADRARAIAAGEPLEPAPPARRAEPTELAVLARTIEQARVAADERRESLRREQQARDEAETANRGKDEFLAMLGHELRNPLAAISNAAHVLELGAPPEGSPEARARGVIRRQVTHLTRLVDDLLDVSRVTQGKIELQRAPLDLAALVLRTAATHGADAPAATASHRFTLALAPAWVDGDATRLEQIVSNLLSNARRYTPTGGCIEIHLARDGGDAVLSVRDDGQGIEPTLLPRVFDLFVQGPLDAARAQGGLGIGLTLVLRLVELHGGRVEARSDGAGRGSCFVVRLPAIGEPPSATRADDAASRRGGPARILIVEDNDDARVTLRHALELHGHEVQESRDGPGGVELALSWRPSVALIDIGLPGFDGREVARRIRAAWTGAPLMLVAVSGYGLPEDRRLSAAAGFDLHAVKPLDADELLAMLAAHEARRSPAAPPDATPPVPQQVAT